MATALAAPGTTEAVAGHNSRLADCEQLVEAARLLAVQLAARAVRSSCGSRAGAELDRAAADLARAQARLHRLLRRSSRP